MSNTKDYIYNQKIKRILSYVEELKLSQNISYEDIIESELKNMLFDLIEHPNEFVDLPIREYEKDEFPISDEWNNFINGMSLYSSLIDDILNHVGVDLNNFIMKHVDNINITQLLLQKQIKALDVLELDIKTSAKNKSISDERRFETDNDLLMFGGSIIGTLPTNIKVNILTPNGKDKKISINSNNVIGKKDIDIFSDGYYEGRMNCTSTQSNTTYHSDISMAFDNVFEKMCEYEYITYGKPNGSFKFVWTGQVQTNGSDVIQIVTDASKQESLYYSYNNNDWIYAHPYKVDGSNNRYVFYTNNSSIIYIKSEYIDKNPEQIYINRLLVNTFSGKDILLNYIESALLEKAYSTKFNLTPICTNFAFVAKQIGADTKVLLERIKKDKTLSYDIRKISNVNVPAYRYSVIIPKININLLKFNNKQEHEIINEFETDNNILSVEVILNEIVNTRNEPSTTLKFFVSNDKINWTQIQPSNYPSNDALPTRVVFNDNYTDTSTSTVIRAEKLKYVAIKAVLLKNQLIYPIIKSYTARIKVSNETSN